MLARMRPLLGILLLLGGLTPAARAEILPDEVAILYNSTIPDSRKLAETYRQARGIPQENLIALDMPTAPTIAREDYERSILNPLRRQFEARSWWRRQQDAGGLKVPVVNKIRVLVTIRGVPLRISPTPKKPEPAPKPGEPPKAPKPVDPMAGRDDASVDSELAMFGIENLPTEGVLQNKFYKSEKGIGDTNFPFMVLTARIDAASNETCERMIRDVIETEKTGLWGKAYVDIANKFPQGDQWLESVVKQNREAGIPTVVDRYNDTLPTNYPMEDASVYYGWYDWNVSGPFLNDRFRFRKGAVAMHLHSFSADQLTDTKKNWCAPLLEKGAAVTIGNVYEPYLHLTHDFGILNERLLAGHSWVEACWMAIPAASWQGVVLGDPLYRPFRHFSGTGVKQESDIEYRALRAAGVQWKANLLERQKQVELASERMKSGILAEAAGLEFLERKEMDKAAEWFRTAKGNYQKEQDKLRQDFNLIGIDRTAGRKDVAVRALKEAVTAYGTLPEALSLRGWLDILDPPPPPPADPTKPPADVTKPPAAKGP
jgi:uncharacterized protein (TIGR03790 family)